MASAKHRTQRMASNRAISAEEWTSKFIGAGDAAQDLVAHAVFCRNRNEGGRCSCSRMPPTNIGGVFSRRCLRESSTAAFQSRI